MGTSHPRSLMSAMSYALRIPARQSTRSRWSVASGLPSRQVPPSLSLPPRPFSQAVEWSVQWYLPGSAYGDGKMSQFTADAAAPGRLLLRNMMFGCVIRGRPACPVGLSSSTRIAMECEIGHAKLRVRQKNNRRSNPVRSALETWWAQRTVTGQAPQIQMRADADEGSVRSGNCKDPFFF